MSRRVKELTAIAVIGDGVVGLVSPRRHSLLWSVGPEGYQDGDPVVCRTSFSGEASGGRGVGARSGVGVEAVYGGGVVVAHSHSEEHSHGSGGGHDHGAGTNKKALAVVLAFTITYMFAEIIGGLITGSLALLADAAHMLSDNVALGLALFAFWLAAKPPTPNRSFGYKRAEILAVLFNGITIVAVSIWIFYEAYNRFQDPPEVLGGWMMIVAVIGLVVNLAGTLILTRSAGENLNMQGALRHVLADLLGSIGVIAAALVILLTGWSYADPIISVFIGVLVLFSSWKLLRESVNILLESSPPGIDAAEVGKSMAGVEGVKEIHDLHIWMVTSGFPALSAHVLVGTDENCHARRRDLEEMLAHEYGIEHTTLQVDHAGDHAAGNEKLLFPKSRREQEDSS